MGDISIRYEVVDQIPGRHNAAIIQQGEHFVVLWRRGADPERLAQETSELTAHILSTIDVVARPRLRAV